MDYITTDNSFSWKRTGMVARFYYPRLKWQLLLYPLLALAFNLTLGYLIKAEIPIVLISPFFHILSWAVYFGPLFLIIKSSREVETTLPATAKEQATCLILYAALLLPLTTTIPSWIGYFIVFGTFDWAEIISYINLPAESKQVIDYMSTFLNRSHYYSISIVTACSLITLLTVVRAKRNRIILSIAFVVAFNFAMTLVAIATMLVYMFSDNGIINEIKKGHSSDDILIQDLMTNIMPSTMSIMAIFGVITVVVLILLIYRGIKNRQV